MGYTPGLAWVKYNQKLVFHLGDTIIIFFATSVISMIHRCSYYDMQCDAEMMQWLINTTTTLKQSTYCELTS